MKLSIITPCYNREDTINRCIESVLNQINDEVEFIIVDDGSTDNSKSKISKYSQIIFIDNTENRGVNYARNRGIEKAKGEYALFLDSDDFLLENSINYILQVINNNDKQVKHFLFGVSHRHEYISTIKKEEICYRDWITNKISGDFCHVVKTDILVNNLFIEEFRAFEYLTWLKIYKTKPATILNKEKYCGNISG